MTFPDIFNLSPSEAADVVAAMLLLWGIAWAFRVLIRFVLSEGDE